VKKEVKQFREDLTERLRPAFTEVLVYPFALLGILSAPFLATAMTHTHFQFRFHWGTLVVALVITAVFVVITELRGTTEQKKKGSIRISRYALAYLLGVFWRMVVPLVRDEISGLVKDLFGHGGGG